MSVIQANDAVLDLIKYTDFQFILRIVSNKQIKKEGWGKLGKTRDSEKKRGRNKESKSTQKYQQHHKCAREGKWTFRNRKRNRQ